MPKTNLLFTPAELEQTQTLLHFSDFGSRPLVKGFTIDSPQSLDLDDALWVETHGELAKIQIHIADPTAVIPLDSPLDRAVRKRVSTLYLSKGRMPMLPDALSEQKLSLLEGEPKFALTLEIELKSNGEILNSHIFESCFLSLGQLSYQQAEQIAHNPEHPLFLPLNSAQLWAQILNRLRVNKGAFAGIIKGNFYLNEDGHIQPISCRSEILIAEYMILANTVVAQWLVDQSLTCLYRNHLPSPDLEPNLIWSDFESVEHQDFRAHYSHCLAKASYSSLCQGHLALATPSYLHFTSPLRRFADFVVHRIVKASLAGQPSPYTSAQLDTLANEINQFHLQQKANKTNYLKQKRDRQLLQITHYSRLEPKDFSRLIELSLAPDSFHQIRPELEIRLQAGQLTNTDLSLILFQTDDLPLQQQIFNHLEDHRFVNLLHNCPKILDQITHLEYEELIYQPERLLFISRLIVTLHNQDLTTPEPVQGKNKKDAKIQAYKFWLQAYLHQQLVPPDQSSDRTTDLIHLEPEVVEFRHPSPAHTLHNLCQQQKWKKPRFQYTRQNGLFLCTATLHLPTSSLSTVGQAQKKRTAQNLAADLLLTQLDSLAQTTKESTEETT